MYHLHVFCHLGESYNNCFDSASFPCLLSHVTVLRNRVVYNIFKVTEIHNLYKFGAILVKQCQVIEVFVSEPRFHAGDLCQILKSQLNSSLQVSRVPPKFFMSFKVLLTQ